MKAFNVNITMTVCMCVAAQSCPTLQPHGM